MNVEVKDILFYHLMFLLNVFSPFNDVVSDRNVFYSGIIFESLVRCI